MAVASGLLGMPALGYAAASDLTGILVVSAIRGLGFGLLTVSLTAFLIASVPVERRGTATGRFGFASGLAGMFGSPAGVWLWQQSADVAWVAGAAMAVIAGLISLSPQFADRPTSGSDGSWARPTETAPVIAGLIGFGCATAAFAAVFSLVPVTVPAIASGVLLAATTAMTVARWAVGSAADRWGFWPFLPVGLVFTVVGLWGLAVGGGAVVYFSAASFGLGFGLMATVSLLAVVAGYGEERLSSASAVWNIVFDSGTALGGLIIAGLAVVMTYGGVLGVFALIHLVGLLGVTTLVIKSR